MLRIAGLGLRLEGLGRGIRPGGQQIRRGMPLESEAQMDLVGAGARQVQHDAGFQLDDAGGDLDQAQAEGVELGRAPGRSFRQQARSVHISQ